MNVLKAFIAGFAATLLFHQPMLWLLNVVGFLNRAPYSLTPTKPFGVPGVVSLAFWGGVWGILFLLALKGVKGANRWPAALVFGAIAPTLVAFFVAAPLKGQPIPGGWKPYVTGLLVNAAWGVGTEVFVRLFKAR